MSDAAGIGAPSGKTAAGENFPVGSFLLPARLRPHVKAFYAFARTADDIADSPDLPAAEKIARLDRLAAALRGEAADPSPGVAHRLRASLGEAGVTARHALDLLDAFRQDAEKRRYADWDELMAYCDRSAAPVGRYLLDLHGEDRDLYPQSDALCNALQVLNHLQDCGEDYRALDRVYVPQDWLAEAGIGVAALGEGSCNPVLRGVLDRMLDETDHLLERADPLPAGMTSRRLAMEAAAVVEIARRLATLLRERDPLAARVSLGRLVYVACVARGIRRGLLR